MGLSELLAFHFLHPAWLLLLPALSALIVWLARTGARDSNWTRVMDSQLLNLLRMSESTRGASAWWLVGVLWALCALALAGPAWRQTPVSAYREHDAWVLVFDLSPSMAATDVSPDRVTRSRYAAMDLLSAAKGSRVGLVAFAGEAHTVSPLTTDTETVRTLLNPLTPKLMPENGDNLAPALEDAGGLLQAGYAAHGQIVVISDGFADPAAAFDAAAKVHRSGAIVNVVGVGNAASTDDELQRVARAGGGLYVRVNEVGKLEERLSALRSDGFSADLSASGAHLTQWRNEGVWLLIPILLVGAALARKGWV